MRLRVPVHQAVLLPLFRLGPGPAHHEQDHKRDQKDPDQVFRQHPTQRTETGSSKALLQSLGRVQNDVARQMDLRQNR